jgi:hypothetical protein
VACLVAIFAGVRLVEQSLHMERASKIAAPRRNAPAPELQQAPITEMVALRASEEAALNRCDWIDRKAGIIRIPVQRAMELTLQRGLPPTTTRMPLPGPPPAPPVKGGAP